MLCEISNPRQVPGEGPRRWFTDDYFDLIVWYRAEGGEIRGFQLCYDKGRNERALTWLRDRGYSHERIDDGEVPGRAKMTPVLMPDGAFDCEGIAGRFRAASRDIDPQVGDFVYAAIRRFAK